MIVTADKNKRTDGTAFQMIEKIKTDIPLVLVSWIGDYVFNEELLGLDRYILFDFVEYGWDGTNVRKGVEWDKWCNFVISKPPLLSFERELPQYISKAHHKEIKPIEYPCRNEIPQVQTKWQFNSRPIEVFFSWGLSNPMRPKLHGEIWSNMDKYGYIVGDNMHSLNGFLNNETNPRKWVTMNCPHYARYDMRNIVEVNGASKLSISLWGAGKKCFRMTESSMNSVMVMPEDNLAYTYEWVHGGNCLKLDHNVDFVQQINDFTKRDDLYEIYVNGVETCRKYHIDNYVKHIETTINDSLRRG